MKRQNVFNRISTKFFSSALLKILVQTAISLLTLKLIEIEELGIWQLVLLVLSFSYLFHLGIINGVSKEIPYLIGKENIKRVHSLLGTALSFLKILYTILFIIFLIVISYLFVIQTLTLEILLIILTGFIQVWFAIQSSYYNSIYRGSSSFKKITDINLYTTVTSVVLFPAVFWWGFLGFLIYQNLLALITIIFYRLYSPYKSINQRFRKPHFFKLLSIGLPILLTSCVGILNKNMVRLTLAQTGLVVLLGKYALIAFIINGLSMIPNVLSQYLFPKINTLYGMNDDKKEIYNYMQKIRNKIFLFGILPLVIMLLVTPILIKMFLPKFSDVILAAQIAIVLGFMALFQLGYNIFHTLNKSSELTKNFLLKTVFYFCGVTSLFFYKPENILNYVMTLALFVEVIFYFYYEYQLKKITS